MVSHLYHFSSRFFKLSGSRKYFNRLMSMARLSGELEESVCNQIENNNLKPKNHPGVVNHCPVSLPNEIKNSISKLLSGEVPKKQLLREAILFQNYLMARKAPIEKNVYFEKRAEMRNQVLNSMGVDLDKLAEEEKDSWNKMIDNKVDNLIKKNIYSWNRIDFTEYMGLLYVVTRSAAEYSVLYNIFKDIYTRSNFSPKTVFDFGSGMGSVIWAANSIWGKSIKEYYCVDSSSHMNTISEEIIKECDKGVLTKKIFYRQFLPASGDISSDIVVSSYSLLELPSKEQRLETVINLWNKTKKYLVLVEFGSKNGFQVLNEARQHIFSKGRVNIGTKKYIFAPCPHHLPCPRAENRCYFQSSYSCFPQKPEAHKKEDYSYIIFAKGEKSDEYKEWPRIVQPVLRRSRHVICRLCCTSGDLKEVIVTPSKHGKIAYRCAKASKWGDLFPYHLKPNTVEEAAEGDVES